MLSLCCIYLAFLLSQVSSQETPIEGTAIEENGSPGISGWVEDRAMNFFELFLPENNFVEGRKKKAKLSKYVLPLVVGFLLIKSILLPIALKTLAVLSGKAVILSLMSLILASIVGLKKVAQGSGSANYEVVNVPLSKYRRNEDYRRADPDDDDDLPYKYYRD
ncbi:uncharacterized protein LOC124293462 [Neodiprion lecontei]|uniref:Uncharacterized protein LOC124293462 n=1 Tax=Neodiprion lecontei TaxID=441921 RepID=A0ABM3FQM6_NEOLC|nr:uncharacterized protein LOC124293462 [Neodiprion lecontei]